MMDLSESEGLAESSEELWDLYHPLEDTAREVLLTFSCMEVGQCLQSCHPEGMLCSGMIQRLLRGEDPTPGSFLEEGAVELCGHTLVTCTVFSTDMRVPFMLFQQRLCEVLDGVEGGSSWDQLQPVFQQCIAFLHFLECYVHRYLVMADHHDKFHPAVDSVAMDIVTHLSPMCMQLDPLEEQLSMLSLGGWGQQAVTNHLVHLVMHSHWTVLSVLYRLVPVIGSVHFLQDAYVTIRRLLSHAAVRYSQVDSLRERLVMSLFPCACVRELWLLLRCTLDRLAEGSNTKSFWMLLSQVLVEVVHNSDPEEGGYVHIAPSDVVGFSWWVLSQLATIYRFSENGALTDKLPLPSNWVFVQELLPLTFKQGVSESQLRCYLHCCLSLSRHWAPVVEPVSKAWDYYHKHMNDSFHLTSRGLLDWISPEGDWQSPQRMLLVGPSSSSTPRQWLQYTHTLCSSCHGNSDPALPERSSFELFLSLLAVVLSGEGDVWRQLRGRFYSKLHKRWLEELGGTGVTHLVSLFLTLASAGDTGEVGSKVVGLLTQLGLASPKEHITPVLWRGIFCLLLLFEGCALNMSALVERLTPHITSLMKLLSSGTCDRRLLWGTVCVVLDGVQELLESPGGVALGAAGMIGGYLGELLTSLRGSELARLLQLVEGVASSLSSHHHTLTAHTTSQDNQSKLETLKAACLIFWQQCGPTLLSKSRDPLPSIHLPSSSAALTTFTCECSPHFLPASPATNLFEEFGLSDSPNPSFTSAYLCHVISNDGTRHKLVAAEPTQWRVLHAWLRCLVLQHNPPACTSHMQELTRLLWQLPVASGLLQSEDPPSREPLPVLQSLLSAINQRHSTAATMQESSQWRGRLTVLLGDLLKYMEPALCGNTPGEGLRTSYKVAAAVVRTCPRLVYSKTDSRCLLPRLVDRLSLPLTTAKKPPVQGITTCTRAHLHHFVHGLLQLEPRRDDFARRKVKQVFSKYFHSYAQPNHPLTQSVPNPFMLLLQPCFESTVSEETSEHLLFILEIITAQFLVLPQQPSSLLPTLRFLRSAVEKIKYQQLLVRCTPLLLGNILSCLLACDVCSQQSEPQGIRKQVMGVLRALLQACRGNQSILPHTSLLPVLRDFIFSNIKQCQAAVFKPLLAVADLHPTLVRGVLPLALRAVEEVEGERGCGKDSSLRSAYHNLECSSSCAQVSLP